MDSFIFEMRESTWMDELLFNGEFSQKDTFNLWLVGESCGDSLDQCIDSDGMLIQDLINDSKHASFNFNFVNTEDSSLLQLSKDVVFEGSDENIAVKGLFITPSLGDIVILYTILPQAINVQLGTGENSLVFEEGTIFWNRSKNL